MWYLILGMITTIYILTNMVLPGTIGGVLEAYVIGPILWILLAITVFLIAKKEGLNIWHFKKIRKWDIGKSPFQAGLLIGGFQVSLLIIAGLFLGLGKSPYSHTPLFIFTNIIFVGSILFGTELSRAYFIKKGTSTRNNIYFTIGIVTILFILIGIPYVQFTILHTMTPINIIKFIGETVIPLTAMSLFASYLAYLGGALPVIGYMGVLQSFQWFSPVLPNLEWAPAALVGTMGPAIGFIIIQNSLQVSEIGRKKRRIRDPTLPWIGVAVVSIMLIFFSFGYLGVQPTVIYSGSMQPSMDVGDIVIVSDVPIETIEEGDIIQYRTPRNIVIHRVHEVYEEGENIFFITKGDANDNIDSEPILSSQVMGKVVFNIPKIGWMPIFFKSILNKIGLNI